MLKNNIEMDVKMRCIEKSTTQAKIAENIGTSPSYVNKIVRSKEQIMNKTFLAMMEDLGFDVELHYVEREEWENRWIRGGVEELRTNCKLFIVPIDNTLMNVIMRLQIPSERFYKKYRQNMYMALLQRQNGRTD